MSLCYKDISLIFQFASILAAAACVGSDMGICYLKENAEILQHYFNFSLMC